LSFLDGGFPTASSSASLLSGGAANSVAHVSTSSSADAPPQEQFNLQFQQESPDYSTGEDTSAIYSKLRKKLKKKTEVVSQINKGLKKPLP